MDIEFKWYRVEDRLPEIPEGDRESASVVVRDIYGNMSWGYLQIKVGGKRDWVVYGYPSRNPIAAWCPIPKYTL